MGATVTLVNVTLSVEFWSWMVALGIGVPVALSVPLIVKDVLTGGVVTLAAAVSDVGTAPTSDGAAAAAMPANETVIRSITTDNGIIWFTRITSSQEHSG